MGYPGGFRVEPERLRVIGRELDEAGRLVRQAFDTRRDGLLVPDRGVAGWSAAGAVRGAAQAWQAALGRLATAVSGVGAELLATADRYEAADRAFADQVRAAGWYAQ